MKSYRFQMRLSSSGIVTFAAGMTASLAMVWAENIPTASPSWNSQAAAAYLDGRMDWWVRWSVAARDHDTACVSCHTALPYALARPAMHISLREHDPAGPERQLLSNVVKRVRLWKEVEPFYPDQTTGLPKSSESRGTEAILNAVILARRDTHSGALTDDTRQAFDNLWALQFKAGDLKGAWAWLNFHLEPWESTGSAYYGAALAAIAVGSAPGGYSSTPEIQDRLKTLCDYLRRGAGNENLFNRVMALWASAKLPFVLAAEQRQAIIEMALKTQRGDGGWALSALGSWKRADETEIEAESDGLATGLIVFVLEETGMPGTDPAVKAGLSWLMRHQDAATGMWFATSPNKKRDPSTNVGKFMSDAATAYAVLALTRAP